MTPQELRELAAAHDPFPEDAALSPPMERTVLRALADTWEVLEALTFHAGMVVSGLEEQYEDDPGDKQARVQAMALRAPVDATVSLLARLARLGEEKP